MTNYCRQFTTIQLDNVSQSIAKFYIHGLLATCQQHFILQKGAMTRSLSWQYVLAAYKRALLSDIFNACKKAKGVICNVNLVLRLWGI